MTQLEEIKSEMTELKSSMEHLRLENVKIREEIAAIKNSAADLSQDQEEPEGSPSDARWFWAFLEGVGSVLEIFPPPGSFDRWRIKERHPESEWASLVREFWDSAHSDENDEIASAGSVKDQSGETAS